MPDLLDSAAAISEIHGHQDIAVAKDVGALFTAHSGDADFAKTTHLLLPEIINQHAQVSSQITAHWYDQLDPGSKFRAKPHADIAPEQIAKSIDWALYAPGEEPPQSRLTGSAQRIVRGTSRDTVTRNAAAEGVRWARYAQPTACSFCRALSMRGSGRADHKWLYNSDKTAGFRKSDGEKYHTHCFCEPIAIRGAAIWTPPEYTADWNAQYKAAARKVKTPSGHKDYFKHLVAQMRSDEPKPEVAVEPVAEKPVLEGVTPQNFFATTEVTARKDALLKSLDAAKDWREVADVADKILPNTGINFGGIIGGLTPETGSVPDTEVARQVVKAADDVLTAFPAMRLESLVLEQLKKDTVYAHEKYWPRLKMRKIAMNRRYTDLPGLLTNSWNGDVASGFHHPGKEDAPAYNIIVHEMGHAMEDIAAENGVTIDHYTLMTALADYWVATRPITPTADADYRQWLLDGLSRYSLDTSNVGNRIALNTPEALAEAFADTFINGDDAQEPSKVIAKVLTDALVGVSYLSTRTGGNDLAQAV